MQRPHWCLGLSPILTIACQARLDEPSYPTGSQSIVASEDGTALYVANTDEGTVSRYDVASGDVHEIDAGSRPSRIARIGKRVYVTLRGERRIAVFEDDGSKLVRDGEIETGAEPMGIVASEEGDRLYVALWAVDEVRELDGATYATLRTWYVPDHPAWLALHPSGDAVYVGSSYGGGLRWIDLDGDEEVHRISLPTTKGAGEDATERLTRRLTGDLWVAPDGRLLVAGGLRVDNETEVGEPDESGRAPGGGGGYGSGGGFGTFPVSRMNPCVEFVPLDRHGEPEDESEMATVFVAGTSDIWPSKESETVRSYISSVAISPDGQMVVATMEASRSVVAMPTTPMFPGTSEDDDDIAFDSGFRFDTGADDGRDIQPEKGGFAESPFVMVGAGNGPRGVAFLPDGRLFVHSFIDGTVAETVPEKMASRLADQLGDGFRSDATFRIASAKHVSVATPALDAGVEKGRLEFYSAVHDEMAGDGSGVSCSTCHFEGRNDGLTWRFTDGVRQTPSLAGEVSRTAPVTWMDAVPGVAEEAMITSQGRMGGDAIEDEDVAAIEAFVDFTPEVDTVLKGSDDASVARGAAIFMRSDVGCGTCHAPPLFTDNGFHDLFGLDAVNTPALIGVSATAPYLHDGSQATLRDVIESSRSGMMGDTSTLDEQEVDDLEAFLYSL